MLNTDNFHKTLMQINNKRRHLQWQDSRSEPVDHLIQFTPCIAAVQYLDYINSMRAYVQQT